MVILVGAFHEVIELCEAAGVAITGLIDPAGSGTILGHPVFGTDEDAEAILAAHPGVPVHVTPDGRRRREIAQRYARLGASFATLVHPSARVSASATLGDGVLLAAGAQVSSASRIGEAVKINGLANVTHDVVIGDYATIAPSACLLGRVRVGAGAYVGANATVLPEIVIGEDATIGAGAVVTRDVPSGATVLGVPARPR